MHARTRTPPYIDHLFSIKIDNLPYRSNMGDVERYFKKFGKVGDIYIPRDSRTHESRGFAFVRYYDERDAEDAIDAMDGAVMDGREIRVAMARNGRPTNENDTRRQSGSRNYSRDYRGGDRSGSNYGRDRDSRDNYRDRRHSPRRRRSRSYSRSKKKSRSRSISPRYHKRSPSKSPHPQRVSKSPVQELAGSQSRSQSRSHSSLDN